MNKLSCAMLAAWVAVLATQAQAKTFYRLDSAVTMKSAAPAWDYVTLDPVHSLLFLGRRKDGVMVYDVRARKIVKTIDKSEDANKTVLADAVDRGYTANEDGTTTIFQLSTLKTLDRVRFGDNADSAVYEPVAKQIVFTMGDSKQVAFMDAKTGRVLGTLAVDSEKIEWAAADGKGAIFVALRDRNAVVKIDVKARKVIAQWKTTGCEEPTGLTYDSADDRVLVGCRGKAPVLAVLDGTSGKVVATPEIGRGNDTVIYDPDTRKVYTSNGVDANLVIYDQVDPDTYKLDQVVTTRPEARTMALDPKTKKVYMVTAEGGVDPSKKWSRGVAPFYPNMHYPDTFVLLTYGQR